MFQGNSLSSMTSFSERKWDTTSLRSWAEISATALRQNARALRRHGRDVPIMAVVKANAYGHGVSDVVRILSGEVQMFGVANLGEARQVRESLREIEPDAARQTPLMILGAALPGEREAIVAEGYFAAVSSVEEAAAYAAHGRARLHLAIDTGMGRMGAWESEAAKVAGAIRSLPNVELAGVCSHLPVADEDETFTAEQLDRFQQIAKTITANVSPAPLTHVENSAALLAFPDFAPGLARAGLALYGVSPLPEFQALLRPALTWKTRVILARNYPKGHGVSYGRTFITDRPMQIATLAVGYADGFQRQVSGRGAHVLIRGHRCPVLGRVTMDQIMVDISALPNVGPGEEVVLIGRQGSEEITAGDFARWAGTIPWHVFTSLGTRVVRLPVG